MQQCLFHLIQSLPCAHFFSDLLSMNGQIAKTAGDLVLNSHSARLTVGNDSLLKKANFLFNQSIQNIQLIACVA
jgi:hypothetical protein